MKMGKLINKTKQLKARLVPLFEIFIGAILLIREIHDFIVLPTMKEVDKMYGGLVDMIKYKEDTYSSLYLWILLLTTGVSYWINKKSYWIFTQILLITLFCIINFFLIGIWIVTHFNLIIIILLVLTLFLFIWLEIKIYKHNYWSEIEINNKTRYVSIILGIASCIIYFSILLLL